MAWKFKGEDVPFGLFKMSDLNRMEEEEREFQATLNLRDPRHRDMCTICEDGTHVLIYWGGYEYAVELSRFEDPEDLLWLIVHLSEKDWSHGTLQRVGAMIEMVADELDWPRFGKVRHRNAAPPARADVAKERAKVTPQIRWKVLKRDGYRCRACGFSVQDGASLHIDHIVPVSKGGQTAMPNLQTLCTACNMGKGASS